MQRTPAANVVPAQAGTHREAGGIVAAWHRLRRASSRGLCLADPWVPAFAGTTLEISENAWAPACAGTNFEKR
jgi:hypothetical protein